MKEQPNFLMIQVDQLQNRFLKAYGGNANTPNIDTLFNEGTAFESCTCPFPLCQPSRASFWTDRYPHKTNILSNGRKWHCELYGGKEKTVGDLFSEAGYQTLHFGKRHDSGTLRGFDLVNEGETWMKDENKAFPLNFDTFRDRYTTDRAVAFLNEPRTSSKPLMMVVDLINPHNICGYIGENIGPNKNLPSEQELPPLPPNFAFDDIENRADPVKYICCSHKRQSQVAKWTEQDFRQYIAAYAYYLGLADSMIGEILTALQQSGLQENTIIVFMSDHGEALAARGSVTKQVAMYQELTQVPLAFCGKGIPKGKRLVRGLISSLDVPPTLFELAGIAIPDSFDGISFKKQLFDHTPATREYVISQWHTEWGYTVEPGRMLMTENFKYIHYLEGNFEEFYDLGKDPYETKNVVHQPEYRQELENHRKLFATYLEESQDPYLSLPWKVNPRWRSHEIGYRNHRGISAPEAE
jgi:choline-sulfatase